MSVSDADIAHAEELFASLGDLSIRKMFGGLGLYHNDQIFSLVSSSGQIFLKAKNGLAEKLATQGSTQFGANHGRLMPYWTLPDAALDDPEQASDWAQQALNAL